MNAFRPFPAAALLSVLLAACDSAGDGAGPSARPSIVFISCDTLRADHMSVYGYESETTPVLEKLAEQATLYRRAQAVSSWTLPSHASMFTGMYPFEHGAHIHKDKQENGEILYDVRSLDSEARTLAEALAAIGYQTAAIVVNRVYLSHGTQLSQGFDHYKVMRGGARKVNTRALEWLDARGEAPFFLFLNYMDTHSPYNCAPYDEENPKYDRKEAGRVWADLTPLVLAGESVDPGKVDELVEMYDASIANLDLALGELFDALRERGVYDETLILVTSDHGEYFGEHSLMGHDRDIYEGCVHVPLIVKAPGQSRGVIESEPISHVHIPSLVAQAGNIALDEADAASFARWLNGPVVAEQYFAPHYDFQQDWASRFDRIRRVLYNGKWKFILSDDGENELYDLEADPEELSNLIDENAELAADMQRAIEHLLANKPKIKGSSFEMSDDAREAAKELGYAGDD